LQLLIQLLNALSVFYFQLSDALGLDERLKSQVFLKVINSLDEILDRLVFRWACLARFLKVLVINLINYFVHAKEVVTREFR